MTKIDFISADNGGIKFYGGRNDELGQLNTVGFAKTPKMVAYILQTRGVADRLMHSSSMDFGFKNNGDAWNMFDAGVELASA
jgi:hypothetical protein